MYRVMCDGYTLHNMTMPDLKLINPKLDLEVNKAGTFSFTIYPSHPYYERLKKLKSIVTVYKNDKIIFRGRILNTEKGFKNQQQVTCEGELAFFNDSTQRPYEFQGDVPELLNHLIDEHNKQVDENKQFKVGEITVKDPNGYIARSDTQYLTTYDSLFQKLVNKLGGYLNFRHEEDGVYLDYLVDFTKLNPQDIEIRKNLIDLKNTIKGEDVATAIIPLGAKLKEENEEGQEVETGKRLTIEAVNGGVDYVYDEAAVQEFGWIFKTVTWVDVTVADNLLRKGREELVKTYMLTNTLEVTAVDLSGTDKEISSFSVGTYNKVKSDLHGLDDLMLVTKQSLNLTAPQSDKLTLGFEKKTFTEQDKDNSDKIGDLIESVDKVENDSNTAVQHIRQELISLINQTSENIKLEVAENYYLKGETDALVQSISTILEQTKDEFNFIFKGFEQDIGDLENNVNSEFQTWEKYIRFKDGKIYLGEVGNELELQIGNDRISFFQNGLEVAYFAHNKLYVTDGEFLNSLTLGNFAFVPRKNGNLSFKKVR